MFSFRSLSLVNLSFQELLLKEKLSWPFEVQSVRCNGKAAQICPPPPRGPRFIGACPGGACLLFPNALVSHILVGIELLLQVAAALRKSAKGLNQIVRHGLVPDCSRVQTLHQTIQDFLKITLVELTNKVLHISKVYDLLCEIGCIMQLYSSS